PSRLASPRPLASPLFPYTTLFRSIVAQALDVVAPDDHITGCYASICSHEEQNRLSFRKGAQCQLRFIAKSVKAGGIHDAQPLPQQWMVEVNQCVTPGRHSDHTVFVTLAQFIGGKS